MASKTQSGQQFSARSMNGIIELSDGQGTLISGGIIQTNDINTSNLTSDFITANNLLEGDVNETITAKWTFSQAPYITTAPTDANDAVNKAYVDAVGTPTIESVLQSGNNANGEAMTGLSNLTMNTGYTPTLDLEVSTKNYSDVFTGKIDATNNSFFTTIELFNPPFQVSGTTTIPQGTYTIQSLLTQISTSLASTFSATIPPSVVITEWTYDITTNKVSARLPSNSTIPELTHRLDPLLQLLGWQGGRSPWTTLTIFNNAPATPADHSQHLPYLKDYVDNNFVDLTTSQSITGTKTFTLPKAIVGYVPSGAYDLLPKFYADNNFVDLTTNQSVAGSKTFTDIPYLTNIRDNSLVNGTLQLYYNNTTGEIGKVLSVSPVIDLEYVLQQGNDANGEAMTGLSNLTMDTGYSPSTALQVATKDYVDNLVAGGGLTEALFFDGDGNSRFQKITGTTPPANMYGGANTMIGFESAYNLPNDILTRRNTFLGYRAGYNYATGYAGATDCTFLGAFAGERQGVSTPYAWNRTTCIGYRSYADKNDQIAIGDGAGETRVRGSLRVDGTSVFSNFATMNGASFSAITTFNAQTNFNSQPYHKIGSISYKLLSEYDAYTQTQVNNLLASKASITQLQTRTPTYFSTWTYGSQNTSFTSLSIWYNGAIPFSHFSPLPSNLGNSTFTIGEYVPAGTEALTQMNNFGTWTANVAGMYEIECVLAMYPAYQKELWIDIYRASTGTYGIDKFFRLRHQIGISGSSPYGVPFNYNSLIYLAVGDGIRVRGNASGTYNFGYVYTYYQHSYLRITRTTGY